MLTRWYNSTNGMRGAPSTDTEALQTDVMRFIAIIGLCLTAIFSLMRSITEVPETSLDDAETLRQQLNSLQNKLDQEHSLTQVLKSKLSTNQARLEHASQQDDELQQMRDRLSDLSRALNNKNDEQQELQQALVEYRAENQILQQQLSAFQQEAERAKNAQPDPHPPAVESASTLPQPKELPQPKDLPQPGFVLKFASAETLNQLVEKNRVQLLAIVKQQTWRLRLHGRKASFHQTAMPDRYYEMLPATLPARYRHAFHTSSKQTGNASTVWAVQIPLNTEQQIQRLLQTHTTGELIIQADGSVRLQSGAN